MTHAATFKHGSQYFALQTPIARGTKVCSKGLGHMTRMTATPIYGKNPLKYSFPER